MCFQLTSRELTPPILNKALDFFHNRLRIDIRVHMII